jgi:signal transduction histidine kinase
VPLAALVRDFLEDYTPQRDYELVVDLRDADVPVRVNRRMIAVVLRHLLTNAVQALAHGPKRRITVRTFAADDAVCCAIEDTGEGLPTADWTAVLAPFYSTKGPFAKDASHAALQATGLGLTVSNHLIALHGGRLELNSRTGEGTTALVALPRGDRVSDQVRVGQLEPENVRAD